MTTEEFKKEIWDFEQSKDWKYLGDKPAIINLHAAWCPPCKKLSPILDELQKKYKGQLLIHMVDVDQEPQIALLFNATTIPLMVFIPERGKPIHIAGLRPKEQLEQIMLERLGLKNESIR